MVDPIIFIIRGRTCEQIQAIQLFRPIMAKRENWLLNNASFPIVIFISLPLLSALCFRCYGGIVCLERYTG